MPTQTINKSAKYPRVAVLLGVSKKWFVPLMLCRLFSTVFALWWTIDTSRQIFMLVQAQTMLEKSTSGDFKYAFAGRGEQRRGKYSLLESRLVVAQLALAYLWASTSGYLSYLFTASLMSRWLQHYSPLAVIVRLCALSTILSYTLMQLFMQAGAMTIISHVPLMHNLQQLSVSLPVWMGVYFSLLLGYFTMQHEISVEKDTDDQRRRQVLRTKCMATLAVTSSVSLVVLVLVVRLGERSLEVVWFDMATRLQMHRRSQWKPLSSSSVIE